MVHQFKIGYKGREKLFFSFFNLQFFQNFGIIFIESKIESEVFVMTYALLAITIIYFFANNKYQFSYEIKIVIQYFFVILYIMSILIMM